MNWVKEHNDRSLQKLTRLPYYSQIEKEIRTILTAKDRISRPLVHEGWYYHILQDQDNPQGVWRRTTQAEYRKKEPKWEVLLDIDALSKKENESWVLKNLNCFRPKMERCLIELSRSGKDAVIFREFDVNRKEFLENGFRHLREAKSHVAWMDIDTVLLASDWGEGSLTDSGYPRTVRLWKRGESSEISKLFFEVNKNDISASPFTVFQEAGNRVFLQRRISFYESETFELHPSTFGRTRLELPLDVMFEGGIGTDLFFVLRSDWKKDGMTLPQGALVVWDGKVPQLLYAPNSKESILQVKTSKTFVYVGVLRNVNGVLYRFYKNPQGAWSRQEILVPEHSSVSIANSDSFSEVVLVSVQNFLTPETLYMLKSHASQIKLEKLKSAPARFHSQGMISEQYFATSRDGTRVPYFVVRKKNTKKTNKTPVVLYGYGGFERSLTPDYIGMIGKVWLEKGGAYALANIRGGGEFGPSWHQAALQKNRQKAFDDFIAVSEDLIQRKITQPKHLGIMGGSNGGLLVSAVMTQRPELFGGVVIQAPLTDMLRYHKLLVGARWMGEYGNPEDFSRPEIVSAIHAYSPYQKLSTGIKYPEPFIVTSTKDDRIHPGHARKFVAKMDSLQSPVLYFENITGSHGVSADLEQRILRNALKYAYLRMTLWQ